MTTPVAGALAAAESAAPATAALGTSGVRTPGARPPRAAKKTAAKPAAGKTTAPPAGRPAQPAKKTAAPRKATTPGLKKFKPALITGPGAGARRTIVAEFALCVLLIGVTPLVMRKPDKDGHLYIPNDIVRLSAVSLLFFILALSANGPRTSRIAAAFGALVTLGVTFNAARSIDTIGAIFTMSNKAGGTTASAPAGTAQVDSPTWIPTDPLSNPLTGAAGPTGAVGA